MRPIALTAVLTAAVPAAPVVARHVIGTPPATAARPRAIAPSPDQMRMLSQLNARANAARRLAAADAAVTGRPALSLSSNVTSTT